MSISIGKEPLQSPVSITSRCLWRRRLAREGPDCSLAPRRVEDQEVPRAVISEAFEDGVADLVAEATDHKGLEKQEGKRSRSSMRLRSGIGRKSSNSRQDQQLASSAHRNSWNRYLISRKGSRARSTIFRGRISAVKRPLILPGVSYSRVDNKRRVRS